MTMRTEFSDFLDKENTMCMLLGGFNLTSTPELHNKLLYSPKFRNKEKNKPR